MKQFNPELATARAALEAGDHAEALRALRAALPRPIARLDDRSWSEIALIIERLSTNSGPRPSEVNLMGFFFTIGPRCAASEPDVEGKDRDLNPKEDVKEFVESLLTGPRRCPAIRVGTCASS